MSDVLNFLRAYPDNPALILSKARVAEAIAEIERLRAELAAERENSKSLNKHLTRARGNTQKMKAERDELRTHAERYACERDYYRAEWSEALNERNALRALLREAYERLPKHMQDRIDAALKASPDDR